MIYEKGSFAVVPMKMVMGIDPQSQLVFMWICYHANQEGNCFPSISTLMKESGLGKTSVINAIKDLVGRKYILKKKRVKQGSLEHDSNLYQILISDEEKKGGVVRHTDNLVRNTNQGSPPHEQQVVRHTDSNYTQLNYTQRTIQKNSSFKSKGARRYDGRAVETKYDDHAKEGVEKVREMLKSINPKVFSNI